MLKRSNGGGLSSKGPLGIVSTVFTTERPTSIATDGGICVSKDNQPEKEDSFPAWVMASTMRDGQSMVSAKGCKAAQLNNPGPYSRIVCKRPRVKDCNHLVFPVVSHPTNSRKSSPLSKKGGVVAGIVIIVQTMRVKRACRCRMGVYLQQRTRAHSPQRPPTLERRSAHVRFRNGRRLPGGRKRNVGLARHPARGGRIDANG